jgi:hypothetical protein
MHDSEHWARMIFGMAEMGDARRTCRLVRMARAAAERPAGQVTQVFHSGAERQASYDLLENDDVRPTMLTAALGRSTARGCEEHERVLIVLDGTSLTLTDRKQSKGLGRIGTFSANASGLKLINAIALRMDGTPIGVAHQNWWVRTERAPRGVYRGVNDRESARWRECVTEVSAHFAAAAPSTKLHFVADREADAALFMRTLEQAGHEFTIRSNANRKVLGRSGPVGVRSALAQHAPVATMFVELPKTPRRSARTAKLVIRAAKFDVRMRDHHVQDVRMVPLTFVWAREDRQRGHVDWMLVTNTEVTTAQDACEVVRRYTKRWRIEDFHRTWKSGVCRVEDTQLRSANAIIKWATILAAVAGRAEALRHQARTNPDAQATTILTADEIQALVLLKSRVKSRVETVTAEGLTVAQAVRWIADLGGYVGNKNSGKPGPTTIARGLDQVLPAAIVIGQLRASGAMR